MEEAGRCSCRTRAARTRARRDQRFSARQLGLAVPRSHSRSVAACNWNRSPATTATTSRSRPFAFRRNRLPARKRRWKSKSPIIPTRLPTSAAASISASGSKRSKATIAPQSTSTLIQHGRVPGSRLARRLGPARCQSRRAAGRRRAPDRGSRRFAAARAAHFAPTGAAKAVVEFLSRTSAANRLADADSSK